MLLHELFDNNPQLSETSLRTDVPNEEWLAGKQEYARKRGRDQWGAPYFDTITAIPENNENVMVSVVRLHLLKGMRREQDNVRQQDLEWLMDYMGRTGKLPPDNYGREYAPFIMVAYNGEAWVSEGNHRIMAAYRLGWRKMPVQIAYFDGGERVEDGIMYPGKIGLTNNLEEIYIRGTNDAAQKWIDHVYSLYPQTWQNNHVMMWGEGDDQELAMFELVPNPARPNHVEVKWFQAYPLRRGVGTRAMRELQRLAQEAGIALTLYAWDKGQVSRSKLMKFYRSVGFRPTSAKSASMIWQPDQVDEGWREKTAALATAATLGYGAYHNATKPNVDIPQAARYVTQKAQPQLKASKPFVLTFADKKPIRDYLVQRGRQAGFTDKELAHLVAQVAHETMDFKHLEEIGNSKYFAKKYDKRYNPRKAKILGNIKLGDGERFKGRGFVHLTGRDNYTRAGRALGVDLVNQPQLAADPKIAADIAVWYWKNRVQPDIEDFSKATVAQVTKPINPGLKGLQDREAKFQKIVNK